MTGVQNNLQTSSLGAITHRNLRGESMYSNADGGGGMFGAIASAVSGVTQGITGALSAKSQSKADIAKSHDEVSIAKEGRTTALSGTTQELIKANEEKARAKQKTQMIMIVATVLVIAVLGFIVFKSDQPTP